MDIDLLGMSNTVEANKKSTGMNNMIGWGTSCIIIMPSRLDVLHVLTFFIVMRYYTLRWQIIITSD